MRCNSPQFLFDPVIVIEGLDSIPKWAKKCVLLRLTSVGAENCRAYYHTTIWFTCSAIFSVSSGSPFYSSASHLLFLYNSRKEYYCYICPNVPDLVCILPLPFYPLLLTFFLNSFYGSHHVIKGTEFYICTLFLQTSLVDLSGQKSDLFRVNVEIHNFLAELSCCPGVVFNTPPSSLGRKDHSKQLLRSSQMMMTSDHNNPGSSEMMQASSEQQHLYPHHHLQHFPRPRKETSITQGLKDHVVGLYSKWDEAFHK